MNTIRKVGEGLGAVALGELVGFISQNLTERIWMARGNTGLQDIDNNSFFDYTLDAMINITFIIMGVSLVEKAVPSISSDLHSLMLFTMGLFYSQQRLPTDLQSIITKLTSTPAVPVAM